MKQLHSPSILLHCDIQYRAAMILKPIPGSTMHETTLEKMPNYCRTHTKHKGKFRDKYRLTPLLQPQGVSLFWVCLCS